MRPYLVVNCFSPELYPPAFSLKSVQQSYWYDSLSLASQIMIHTALIIYRVLCCIFTTCISATALAHTALRQ
jgi:hypothetical protein